MLVITAPAYPKSPAKQDDRKGLLFPPDKAVSYFDSLAKKAVATFWPMLLFWFGESLALIVQT